MILVVDNNDERRKNTITWLRVKGYMATGTSYSELPYYTKPFMTVYMNPTAKEAEHISNSGDTLSVLICDRFSVKTPPFAIRVSTLTSAHISIMKIFDEKFNHFGYNQMEIVGYACLKNDEFALGGELIGLSNLEYLIVCFFMVNKNKRFKIYDCAAYFNYKANPEENFRKSIYKINAKCKREHRLPLIIADAREAYFNPTIASYVCPPYEEPPLETDDMKDFLIININDEY